MSKTSPNYNCLFRIPNDETNRAIIKEVRKMMRDYGTMWRVVTRGRKPKPGTGPYPYGSVPLENAQELGIYLYEKQSVSAKKWKLRIERSNRWEDQIRKEEQAKYAKLIESHLKLESKLAYLVGSIQKQKDSADDIQNFIYEYTGGNA